MRFFFGGISTPETAGVSMQTGTIVAGPIM